MAAVVLTAALLLPLTPHSTAELADWHAEWLATPETSDIKVELLRDMEARHPCFPEVCQLEEVMPTADYVGAVATPPSASAGVEQWRPLVAAYFSPENVDRALSVLGCETGWTGNPSSKNPTSTAAGLFQFLRSTWDRVAIPLGYGSYDSGAVYDPVANVHAAAVLSSGGWDWSQWSCKP